MAMKMTTPANTQRPYLLGIISFHSVIVVCSARARATVNLPTPGRITISIGVVVATRAIVLLSLAELGSECRGEGRHLSNVVALGRRCS
jgi:hypothetical protein